ncbi:MAG: GntR family transcriptional regulator [Planctomycetota bacterium]
MKTVREQVTTKLRDELVAGQYEGGKVLREAELAARMGVSRGPVRDAILQLANEGFLAYQANRGVTVKHPPNTRNRAFIVSLRIQIEVFAIETGLEDMSDEAMEKIEHAMNDLKRACVGDDAAMVARYDMAFHEAIIMGCGGEDFINAWKQLCAKMLMNYTRLEDYAEVFNEHVHILDHLRERDAKQVIKAIRDNIQ